MLEVLLFCFPKCLRDKIFSAHLVSLKKRIIRASILIIAFTLLGTTNSKATLQANATTHKSPTGKNGATWLTQIRRMETSGQTMGLTETLNGLNATSASNGIDVHMMLPTEYGAVAILSASGYGNSGKLRDEADAQKRTTTGNSTGVYFTGDRWEWMASSSNSARAKYDNSNKNLIGSIMNPNGTVNWHSGASNSTACAQWEYYKGNNPCLMRESNLAGGAGIFSWGVGGSAWVADSTWHEANRWGAKSSWSRGVANMIYKNNS